jgi:8-oxo-dGTP pyrophosphatase MutT (NUDIX family)
VPTPRFILELRKHVGQAPLFLSGVKSVVFDDRSTPQQVLVGKRADNGRWRLPAGVLEPGEQPAQTVVREVLEETGVQVRVDRLIKVETLPMITYPNGDQVQYLSCVFRAHYLSGEAHVADDESTEVGWCDLDQAPDLLPESDLEAIKLGLPIDGPTHFEA